MTPDALTIAAQFLAADPEFLRLPADSRRLRAERALQAAHELVEISAHLHDPAVLIMNDQEAADHEARERISPSFSTAWGRLVAHLEPEPAVTVKTAPRPFPCRKVRVRATLVIPGGRVFVAENHIQHDPGECPREGMEHGQGYAFCKAICRQPGHAETNALELAKGHDVRGGVIYLEGHTRLCDDCARACSLAGVTVVRADGQVLLEPTAREGVERDPGFHASALERMQAGVQR